MVERFNGTLKACLGALQDDCKEMWVHLLQVATFAYNTSRSEATHLSPYFALYGREAVTPGDLVAIEAEVRSGEEEETLDHYAEFLLDSTRDVHQYIHTLFDTKQREWEKERLHRARINVFRPGDIVYVKNESKQAGNQQVRWLGPSKVLVRISETVYSVEIPRSSHTHSQSHRHSPSYITPVHISRLKPGYVRIVNDQPVPPSPPLPNEEKMETDPPHIDSPPPLEDSSMQIDEPHLDPTASLAAPPLPSNDPEAAPASMPSTVPTPSTASTTSRSSFQSKRNKRREKKRNREREKDFKEKEWESSLSAQAQPRKHIRPSHPTLDTSTNENDLERVLPPDSESPESKHDEQLRPVNERTELLQPSRHDFTRGEKAAKVYEELGFHPPIDSTNTEPTHDDDDATPAERVSQRRARLPSVNYSDNLYSRLPVHEKDRRFSLPRRH